MPGNGAGNAPGNRDPGSLGRAPGPLLYVAGVEYLEGHMTEGWGPPLPPALLALAPTPTPLPPSRLVHMSSFHDLWEKSLSTRGLLVNFLVLASLGGVHFITPYSLRILCVYSYVYSCIFFVGRHV